LNLRERGENIDIRVVKVRMAMLEMAAHSTLDDRIELKVAAIYSGYDGQPDEEEWEGHAGR
jgi:hypothetical protein